MTNRDLAIEQIKLQETKKQFNRELFMEVFEQNLKVLFNGIMNEGERKSILTGNPLVTDDENRQMAVDFFNKTLCKFLYERL